MSDDPRRKVLEELAAGALGIDEALKRLDPTEDLGYARVDHDRARRRGIPEVIYGAGKTPEQVVGIFSRLADRGPNVLATRVTPEAAAQVQAAFPEAEHCPEARLVRLWRDREPRGVGTVGVIAAGTSDLPVAGEAARCAELMGNEVFELYDVGVAGLHRLLGELDRIRAARVLVVVAGMEGALPTVVGGLVDRPVIAVPTSVGYGAAFGGLAPLLGMLNSCSGGVSVVNIDNGFGAAFCATLFNRP